MKFSFISTLAWRYLKTALQEKNSSTMLRIAFLTIMMSVMILSLAAAIMHGFQKATYAALKGINPEVIIEVPQQQAAYEELQEKLSTSSLITISSPVWETHALLEGNNAHLETFVLLQGIRPSTHTHITALLKTIVLPTDTSLESMVHDHSVLIGITLAATQKLTLGDTFTLLYIPTEDETLVKNNSISFARLQLRVGGIIKTGIEEIDGGLVIGSDTLFEELWPEKLPSSIGGVCTPFCKNNHSFKELSSFFGTPVYDWQSLYPSLVAALKLESLVVLFILGLISLLASLNIGGLLTLIINQKKIDIAILKSLGASSQQLRTLFFLVGTLLVTGATLVGLSSALLISSIFTHLIPLKLPDAYYIEVLPIELSFSILISVFLFSIAMSSLTLLWATTALKDIKVSETLRFNG